MTPGDFANFSAAGAAEYSCSANLGCFETGNVSSGRVYCHLAVFDAVVGGNISVVPWFFVMMNPDSSVVTNITWTTGLTATYLGVYGPAASSETVIASARSTDAR